MWRVLIGCWAPRRAWRRGLEPGPAHPHAGAADPRVNKQWPAGSLLSSASMTTGVGLAGHGTPRGLWAPRRLGGRKGRWVRRAATKRRPSQHPSHPSSPPIPPCLGHHAPSPPPLPPSPCFPATTPTTTKPSCHHHHQALTTPFPSLTFQAPHRATTRSRLHRHPRTKD